MSMQKPILNASLSMTAGFTIDNPMNKILFLDIDGVLNSLAFLETQDTAATMDPVAVERLNRIVDATQCKIVVSSSWRCGVKFSHLVGILRNFGVRGEIIDKTPELDIVQFSRGDEINTWLRLHSEVTHFVILDDNTDPQMRNLVETHFKTGLTDEHVEQAIRMLNG